jgi:hypothetical protein
MRWRRRRVDLGTYQHPPVRPLPSIEAVLEEGLLIEASAVRMAVKNALIIAALRDHSDFDEETISQVARERFLSFARENEGTAERLSHAAASEGPEAGVGLEDHELQRLEAHLRRPAIHRLLAAMLRAEAENPGAIAALVDRARVEAAQEVGLEILGRLHAHDFAADPEYERERASRIRRLVVLDLAQLRRAQDRGTVLRHIPRE